MADARHIRCPHCGKSNRLERPGLHACSHCGSDFYARHDEAALLVHSRGRVLAHIAMTAVAAFIVNAIVISVYPRADREITDKDLWAGVGLLAAIAIIWGFAIYRGAWVYHGKAVSTLRGGRQSLWMLVCILFVQFMMLQAAIWMIWRWLRA